MLEAVLAQVNTAGPNLRLFTFLSGIGDEQVYDVSFRDSASEISSIFQQYAEHSKGNLGIGIYRYTHLEFFFYLLVLTTGINDARPAFLDALVPFLDSGVTKFNKRCVSLGPTSSGRQVLHFSDHTTYEADLVIGADGIKSVVRNAVVSGGHLVFSNTYVYRGLIPINNLKSAGLKAEVQSRPHNWVGLGGVCTPLLLEISNRSLFYIRSHKST